MKRLLSILLLAALCLPVALQSCKTETEPHPLADINTLAGRWTRADGYEMNFDVATRQGTFIKVPANVFGFKVGDVSIKNVEAVDATTFRGESRYRSGSGYYLFADVKITVSGDVMKYVSDSGSLGSISVTGQTGEYQRVN